MDFVSYIPTELAFVVAGLYAIGMVIKGIPKTPDWIIPIVLILIGILLSCGLLGVNVTNIVYGILCASAAVTANQVIKQTKNNKK